MNPKVVKSFIFTILGLGVILGGIVLSKPIVKKYEDARKYQFTLETIDGPVKLDDFKGKTVALYFGYMYCPDVCPTSLSSLSEAVLTLSVEEQKKFQGIFVSVDPARDTLEHLKGYALYFHENFIGATHKSEDYLHDLVHRYGGSFRKVNLEGSEMGYSVNHTSEIYIFDKEGHFSEKISHFSKHEDIVNALKKAL